MLDFLLNVPMMPINAEQLGLETQTVSGWRRNKLVCVWYLLVEVCLKVLSCYHFVNIFCFFWSLQVSPHCSRQTDPHSIKTVNIFAYKTTTITINDAVNVLNEARAPVCVWRTCVHLYDFNNTYQTSADKNITVSYAKSNHKTPYKLN